MFLGFHVKYHLFSIFIQTSNVTVQSTGNFAEYCPVRVAVKHKVVLSVYNNQGFAFVCLCDNCIVFFDLVLDVLS